MSNASTMKRTAKRRAKMNWSRFDAMTEEQRHAAAMVDPDAQPIRPEDLARMPLVPRIKVIRRALKLSQEAFAAQFCIPIAMLRDWETGREEPDAAVKAYLRVIAREPAAVRKALRPLPQLKP